MKLPEVVNNMKRDAPTRSELLRVEFLNQNRWWLIPVYGFFTGGHGRQSKSSDVSSPDVLPSAEGHVSATLSPGR